MQINRLLEIVYILLEKKVTTARELSYHFEVSQRTIYRDIDTLSAAGIPVYTNRGRDGGISLLDNFVIHKTMFSEKEQNDILSSLQGLRALNVPDVEPVLNKLAGMFDKKNLDWIDVDFAGWGRDPAEREKFKIIKTAILSKSRVSFDYYSSYGEKTERAIEPMKLIFKGRSWYAYGFCTVKNDFRIFKITRIKNIRLLEETFIRDMPADIWSSFQDSGSKLVELVLKIDAKMEYRIYDEFDQESISKDPNGSFMVTMVLPEDEWVYGYILSFGNNAEVLEPEHIRKIIKSRLEDSLKKYIAQG